MLEIQDRYAGKIQHNYTGSTPVTEKMWQDLMKKAINAATSSMVLANKYKQMKNKMQQTQTTTSGITAATTSTVKTTQKQYTTNPKTTVISSLHTSVMKPVGTGTSQSQNKDQNWKDKGSKTTTTNNTSTSVTVPTTSKNGKYTSPITRTKTKNDLIQLLETIPENVLSDSETECEDNNVSGGGETEIEEGFIYVSHSDVEEQ